MKKVEVGKIYNTWSLAVCTEEEWDTIISSLGYDRIKLRDARYNQVIHLVTAANGAESFYQLANNSTRTEGLELAIERDRRAADVSKAS